jgi:hypothetical protein
MAMEKLPALLILSGMPEILYRQGKYGSAGWMPDFTKVFFSGGLAAGRQQRWLFPADQP